MQTDSLTQLITHLLETLGIETDTIALMPGQRVVVNISTPDPKRLIGPEGEHLRALNVIVRRLIETKYGEEATDFLIDVNGYREKQLDQVRAGAQMLAQRARLFKHDVEMSPMSSYERLVIHELFAEDPEIQTESQGTGKFRHVVLKYRQGNSIATV